MKRVNLFKNGSFDNGKVVMLSDSLEDFMLLASKKLEMDAKKLFTPGGGEITDVESIKDEDVLYVSSGEPFVAKISTLVPAAKFQTQDWVLLNVGGSYFATTRMTLTTKEPKSMLAHMFAADDEGPKWQNTVDYKGAVLIDRSPVYFEPILNFLRHGQLTLDKNINPEGVLEEARFFGIDSLASMLENLIKEEKYCSEHSPLSRKDVIKNLISTSCTTELRFQGVTLAESDLSRLDLRHINFKYANLRKTKLTGANLSYCCLERTDLSYANLEGAVLLGVKMLCANLEGANMKSCNMEDPAGNKANMEGVNLKGADLEGSQMAGVNLRVATLKNANLQNCDLRGAILAGADLENCDLSGSDLHEANLRGANLKDTAFELMLTPLHMAQAIR